MDLELRAMQLMEAAFDLPETDRLAFVERECGGDSQLLRRVLALVDGLEDHDDFLATRQASADVANTTVDRIGEYRILREIGRGGMGVVYEAEHDSMQRRVALKTLPEYSTPSQSQLERFYREARAAGQLHHSNIVPVFEVGSADGRHYYTMQYIEGATLDLVVQQLKLLRGVEQWDADAPPSRTIAAKLIDHQEASTDSNSNGPLRDGPKPNETVVRSDNASHNAIVLTDSVFANSDLSSSAKNTFYRRVAAIGLQSADALRYAHQHGILHRDIKPANLILDTNGVVWVLDFGLAKSDDSDLTQTGDVIGTLRYMAPERLDGHEAVESDIYSLGLTLYELATLQHPFSANDRASLVKQITTHDAAPPRSIDAKIPRDLETIILKAIESTPTRRYPSAEELCEDLRLFLMDHPISARRISPLERAIKVCRRNPVVSALAVACALMLVLVTLGASRLAYLSAQRTEQAVQAEKESQLRQYELSLSNAESLRKTGERGCRFETLKSIREAVELLPKLGFSREQLEAELVKLRSEAVSALTRFDLAYEESWVATRTHAGAFSQDCERLAYMLENADICIRSVQPGTKRIIKNPFRTVFGMTFSGDGRYLLTRHPGIEICIWDIDERSGNLDAPIFTTKVHYRGTANFAKAANRLAISFPDAVRVYSLPNCKVTQTIPLDFEPSQLRMSDDGQYVAVAQFGFRSIQIWDVANEPRLIRTVGIPSQLVAGRTLEWSRERSCLVVGLVDGTLVVWQDDFEVEPKSYKLHKQTISQIALHPSRPLVITCGWDSTTRVFDLSSEKQVMRLEQQQLISSGFNADGTRLGLFSTQKDRLRLCRVPKAIISRHRLDVSGEQPASVHRSADVHPVFSDILVTANSNRVELWNREIGIRLREWDKFATPFVRFANDGKSLFVLGSKGCFRVPISVHRIADQSPLRIELGTPELILSAQRGADKLDVSADEQNILVVFNESSADAHAKLFSLTDVTHPILFDPIHQMSDAALSPDGRWVSTTAWRSPGIEIWDAKTGERIETLLPETQKTHSKFSPDSRHLVASHFDEVFAWEVGTWQPVAHSIERSKDMMGDLDFDPESNLLVADKTRFLPQIIDWTTRQPVLYLNSSVEDAQTFYAFSRSGSHLAVGGSEFAVVWHISALREQLRLLNLDW